MRDEHDVCAGSPGNGVSRVTAAIGAAVSHARRSGLETSRSTCSARSRRASRRPGPARGR
ncbi:MAG: hypothetical protein ACXVXM_08175 [Nocardioidaceae bacterium]